MAGVSYSRIIMAYIRKHPAPLINDDGFDFEKASDEWVALCLWDQLQDCFKDAQVINEVLRLAQSSPELLLKMNLRWSKNG